MDIEPIQQEPYKKTNTFTLVTENIDFANNI